LLHEPGEFVAKKESGCMMKKQTTRQWIFPDLYQAELFYNKKIKAKTNPGQESWDYKSVNHSALYISAIITKERISLKHSLAGNCFLP
jgi:hypothetical protein